MAGQGTQGGTAHSKAEAEEWAEASACLANGPADDLIAGTMASAVPGNWAFSAIMTTAMLPPALAVDLPVSVLNKLLAGFACAFVGSVISTVMAARMRRLVYLTVTQDEFICYRVPKMSQQPAGAEVLFRASPRAVRVKAARARRAGTGRYASRPAVQARKAACRSSPSIDPGTGN